MDAPSRWEVGSPDPEALRKTARRARELPREPMSRRTRATVGISVVIWAATVCLTFVTLPNRVPTHWSSGTKPDAWSSRGGTLLTEVLGAVGINVVLALIPLLVLRWPQGINAPNKQYWLETPQRLRHFERLIREDMSLLGALCMLLFAGIAVLMAVAARRPGGEMPGMMLAVLMVGFVAGMIAFLMRMLGHGRYSGA